MNTKSTAAAVKIHMSNADFISKLRMQANGRGKVRVLIPCFFGLFWKTWKEYIGSYDGGGFYTKVFDNAEEAWLSVEQWNAKIAKEIEFNTQRDAWTDVQQYCR